MCTKGTHLCYQGYPPILPRAPARAHPLHCLAFYLDRYGNSQLVRAVIHVENDASDRQLIEAATRVEITLGYERLHLHITCTLLLNSGCAVVVVVVVVVLLVVRLQSEEAQQSIKHTTMLDSLLY